MKKIYLADSYSLNTGDAGILFATLDYLKKAYEDYEVIVEVSHPEVTKASGDPSLKNLQIYPRIFDLSLLDKNKLRGLVFGAYDLMTFLICALMRRYLRLNTVYPVRKERRQQAERLFGSDILLSSGGGFLSSRYKYGFRLYIYTLGLVTKKEIIIFRQSIGPFETRLSRFLIPYFLRRIDKVIVRESYSQELLKKYKIKNVVLEQDIAFTLRAKILKKLPGLHAICIKKTANESKYAESIIALSKKILSKKTNSILITSQTPSDDGVALKLKNKLDDDRVKVLPFSPDARMFKSQYSKAEFLISSRMHAIIFAAKTCGKNIVTLSYEPKFSGLTSQLGIEKGIVNDHEISPKKLIAAYGSINGQEGQ